MTAIALTFETKLELELKRKSAYRSAGYDAYRMGLPFDENASDAWKAGYMDANHEQGLAETVAYVLSAGHPMPSDFPTMDEILEIERSTKCWEDDPENEWVGLEFSRAPYLY